MLDRPFFLSHPVEVEEMKSLDVSLTTESVNVSTNEKLTGFVQKVALIMKLITIVVDFLMILTAGVIAKGAIIFITAQVSF